jgi:Na+-translocating ferredoxin:NAD+ oxidoreductase subunit B
MEKTDKVYTDLQEHLDKQAVGFPATRSGVEIRILKELFNPEQASLALHVNYKPQSACDIFNSQKDSGVTLEKVSSMLEEMDSNGAIGSMDKMNTKYYYTMPLLVGIVELHNSKATPQFSADFGEYMRGEFGKAYASTSVSQMRTIPVEKSIRVENHVTTYDHVREVIASTEGPIAISSCMCREGAEKRGKPCHVTKRKETCMVFGEWAGRAIASGRSREITREEALEIIRQNEADGLVLQPTNYRKIDFLCSCCGDCCGILISQKMQPNPGAIWAHNFYAAVDPDQCSGCGTCAEKCQVNAAKMDEQKGYAVISLNRCIGCGNCVAACPSEAIKLVKKEKETTPPEERTDLYKILAERKS